MGPLMGVEPQLMPFFEEQAVTASPLTMQLGTSVKGICAPSDTALAAKQAQVPLHPASSGFRQIPQIL